MRSTTATLPDNRDTASRPSKQMTFVHRVADVIELIKPRLVVMILITTAAGFLSRCADDKLALMSPYTGRCWIDGSRSLGA